MLKSKLGSRVRDVREPVSVQSSKLCRKPHLTSLSEGFDPPSAADGNAPRMLSGTGGRVRMDESALGSEAGQARSECLPSLKRPAHSEQHTRAATP